MVPYSLDLIAGVFTSVGFWAAVSSLGTVITLFFIYKQIANARNVGAYEFLRREDDRFRTRKMKRARSNLARHLLLDPERYGEMEDDADEVLDYLEDLGLMLRRGLASTYFLWTVKGYYILRYWRVLEKYINWSRKEYTDQTYFIEFENLHSSVLKMERSARREKIEFSKAELHDFLQDELQVQLQPMMLTNLDRIVEVENCSFNRTDAYPKAKFEELYRDHADGYIVAEMLGDVAGYVIGYVSDGAGEIDSIAVDPRFRRLGIGRRLLETILDRFKQDGVKSCSLEVRTTNDSAILLYRRLGFEVDKTLERYYDDGGAAYLMKTALR